MPPPLGSTPSALLSGALRAGRRLGWWAGCAALLLTFALLMDADTLRLTPAQEAIAADRFGMTAWVARNTADAGREAVAALVPLGKPSNAERRRDFARYFALGAEERAIDRAHALAIAREGATGMHEADALQDELASLRRQRADLRGSVETVIADAVTEVLREEGLTRDWGVMQPVFPPVLFSLEPTPRVLVVSPRERIANVESRLLRAETTPRRIEVIEAETGPAQDASAVVVRAGGIATFPALVSDTLSLQSAVRTVAHEWLHHYLVFHPLGRNYFTSATMTSLNETVADLAGRELGDRALARLAAQGYAAPVAAAQPAATAALPSTPPFDFAAEMRETRLAVDALLAEGRVDAAEAYMEERRLRFVDHGYAVRRLNQAYFAFHGAYAESPASSSPIGGQVRRVRDSAAGIADFVRVMREFGSHEAFLAHVEGLEDAAATALLAPIAKARPAFPAPLAALPRVRYPRRNLAGAEAATWGLGHN